jgi:hypothetical protein
MLMEMSVMRCMVLTALRLWGGGGGELWVRESETGKKGRLREDERWAHEAPPSTKCSGFGPHSWSQIKQHNHTSDICIIDYSLHKQGGHILILTKCKSTNVWSSIHSVWFVESTEQCPCWDADTGSCTVGREILRPLWNPEIRRYSSQYSARLSAHPNDLIVNHIELPDKRRLRRHLPNDLPTRFLV